MESMDTIYVLIGIYLSVALLTIPMIQKKLKPSSFFGFRVRATLENEVLWYKYNRIAGFWLLGLSLITVAALAFAALWNFEDPDTSDYMAHSSVIAFTIALVINTFVLMVLAEREGRKLRPTEASPALADGEVIEEKGPA